MEKENHLFTLKFIHPNRENELGYDEERLSVAAPTPTPGNKRRRELIRQARSQLVPGDTVGTPGSSRCSTPGRSRQSTPQRNRIRRNQTPILSPVLPIRDNLFIPTPDSLVPNSPPPPYEITFDSPFLSVRLAEEYPATDAVAETKEDSGVEIKVVQITPAELDCGCPGACGCGPPSLNPSVDSTSPLIMPQSFDSEGINLPVEQTPVKDISLQQRQQQSTHQNHPNEETMKGNHYRLTRSFFSVDDHHHPALRNLYQMQLPWNKSL